MGNPPRPEGREIDRAMIPKVPGGDKKSARAGAPVAGFTGERACMFAARAR